MAKKKEDSVSTATQTYVQMLFEIYSVEKVYSVGGHFFIDSHHAENHANSNGLEIVTYTKNGEDTTNTGE